MRPTVAVLLLAGSLVSGCLSGDDAVDAVDGTLDGQVVGAPAGSPAALAAPPVWSVGDFWTFDDTEGRSAKFVVVEDAGDYWVTMTTDPNTAWFDTRTDVSFLGPQRKADLAGSQGAEWVRYYEWPLTLGRTWTTTWDGEERRIEVVEVDRGRATLEARVGEQVRVRYVYDVAVGWTSDMTFFDADGTGFNARVVDHGSDFPGEAVRWVVGAEVRVEGAFGALASELSFEVPVGATDIYLEGNVTCPSGGIDFGFGPQDDFSATWGVIEACPYEHVWAEPVVGSPAPGSWGGGVIAVSPLGEGTFAATIWVRTLETVAIGG